MHFSELRWDLGEGTESSSGQGPRLSKHLLLAGEQRWVPPSGRGPERTEGGGERGAGQDWGDAQASPVPSLPAGTTAPRAPPSLGISPCTQVTNLLPSLPVTGCGILGSVHYICPIYKAGSAPSPRAGRVGFVKH